MHLLFLSWLADRITACCEFSRRALIDLDGFPEFVVGANGSIVASQYAQGIADFFDDDGMLLRRFIFRLEEDEVRELR